MERAPHRAGEGIDAGERVVVIQHEYQRGRGSGVEIEIETARYSMFAVAASFASESYSTGRRPSKPWGCPSSAL